MALVFVAATGGSWYLIHGDEEPFDREVSARPAEGPMVNIRIALQI